MKEFDANEMEGKSYRSLVVKLTNRGYTCYSRLWIGKKMTCLYKNGNSIVKAEVSMTNGPQYIDCNPISVLSCRKFNLNNKPA